MSIVGGSASHFAIDFGTASARRSRLSENCTVDITFDPATTGLKTATLQINSSDPDEDPVDRALSGTGTSGPTTGTIKIVLDAVPNSAQDFGFTGDTGKLPRLDDDNDIALPNSRTVTLAPGTYDVTQGTMSGWSLTGLSCTTGETTDIPTRTVTIGVAAGENVVCTFTDYSRLTDAKISRRANRGLRRQQHLFEHGAVQPDEEPRRRPQSVPRSSSFGSRTTASQPTRSRSTPTGRLKQAHGQSYFSGATDITAAVLAGTYTG